MPKINLKISCGFSNQYIDKHGGVMNKTLPKVLFEVLIAELELRSNEDLDGFEMENLRDFPQFFGTVSNKGLLIKCSTPWIISAVVAVTALHCAWIGVPYEADNPDSFIVIHSNSVTYKMGMIINI